jgi:hypothetical protein
MHCHPFPDLFPRLADDLDIAIAARDAGLKALMLKCHHESTVSRAYLIQRVVPGIRVFGGVVLNSYVGGINAAAVETALRLGGMPEFGSCTISPAWQYASPDKVVQAIKRVGASRCLRVSDTGQRHNPLPSEALRIFAQTLFERGIAEEDIHTMIMRNPNDLLDVDAAPELPDDVTALPGPPRSPTPAGTQAPLTPPNEPFHLTAVRLRFGLNLKGHGGAAAGDRQRQVAL